MTKRITTQEFHPPSYFTIELAGRMWLMIYFDKVPPDQAPPDSFKHEVMEFVLERREMSYPRMHPRKVNKALVHFVKERFPHLRNVRIQWSTADGDAYLAYEEASEAPMKPHITHENDRGLH